MDATASLLLYARDDIENDINACGSGRPCWSAGDNFPFLATVITSDNIYGLEIWNWDVKLRCCQMHDLDAKSV